MSPQEIAGVQSIVAATKNFWNKKQRKQKLT